MCPIFQKVAQLQQLCIVAARIIFSLKNKVNIENVSCQRFHYRFINNQLGFRQILNILPLFTLFKHKERQKVTWRSPDGTTKNCIDYVLVSKLWKTSMLDTVVLVGEDFDSDYTLVMASFCLRLKSAIKLQKSPKIPS